VITWDSLHRETGDTDPYGSLNVFPRERRRFPWPRTWGETCAALGVVLLASLAAPVAAFDIFALIVIARGG
jgi:hypothetical protein